MTIREDKIHQAVMEQYGFGPEAMKKIKICGACGSVVSASRQFCGECGARLPNENLFQAYREKHQHCWVCGTVVSDGTKYCPQCGMKLKMQ